jgi:hypothetical protein
MEAWEKIRRPWHRFKHNIWVGGTAGLTRYAIGAGIIESSVQLTIV